ncbi:hypothetical protein DNU06_16800 [Putridiphycobacter roseus]|uniref:Uncharacterized protein n=1 Tax=Putridiphycobacter roseus TaxID=2219161 RepID=A0A2W1N8T8_9FLAO|nr:hypothetical protein [Putridiphycobacter roseus]PZE15665.1 hypothetical protein DNU06_16800 [Putridiphycobacter roseus]
MKPEFKIILTGIGASIVSILLQWFFNYYVLVKLGDWTMALNQKFLVHQTTTLDVLLLNYFPIIIAGIFIVGGVLQTKQYRKFILWTSFSIIIMMILGFVVGLITWTTEGAVSPLLQQYIKYQPFKNYWTIFITLGVLIPLIIKYLKRIKK